MAIDRYGKRFINFVIGDRSSNTARKLWKVIAHHKMKHVASDYWRVYEEIIPPEKHIQSKAETFTVEGHNSLFRHFLARMRGKSKCYSKAIKMLQLAMLLLMTYANQELKNKINKSDSNITRQVY